MLILSAVWLLTGSIAFVGCEEKGEQEVVNESEFIYENLPSGVLSIEKQNVKGENLYELISENPFCSANKSQNISGEATQVIAFNYENNMSAVMFTLAGDENSIFINVVDNKTNNIKEFFIFKVGVMNNVVKNFTLKSYYNEFDYAVGGNIISSGNKSLNSWGSCMTDAMNELYNDWEDAPVESFACVATGWYCAAGGAIACGIKQL